MEEYGIKKWYKKKLLLYNYIRGESHALQNCLGVYLVKKLKSETNWVYKTETWKIKKWKINKLIFKIKKIKSNCKRGISLWLKIFQKM